MSVQKKAKVNPKHGIILKEGREKSVLQRHPWIFSGAIQEMIACQEGSIIPVYSSSLRQLGSAFCNTKSQIRARMVAYGDDDPEIAIKKAISNALLLRNSWCSSTYSNANRLINAEADLLPGLVVDLYDQTLVLQISTLGMEKIKPLIVDELVKQISPSWIYEKSNAPSRKEEGLKPIEQTLFGTPREPISIYEGDVKLEVSVTKGQKTGFFLDQRLMRKLVHCLSKDKRVLNCFSYTGAFSLQALSGGAISCDSVDISKEAIAMASRLIELNGFQNKNHLEIVQDAFVFLKESTLDYDLIILDPPAFAKRKSDIPHAARGYKEINRLAMMKIPPNSLLLTCSCSYHISEDLFGKILFGAALDAKRHVTILQRHRQAFDHPVSLYHPEGSYLKSFLCHVA